MRFSHAYSRPSLTPLGERLLHISERKLYDLEYPPGQRDSGAALHRGVLVRETVRSAWLAVEQGHQAEVNDWTSTNALGLDVIGEDDEEEAAMMEKKEEKWFEDLLAELGEEDEEEYEHEAAEENEETGEESDSDDSYEDYEDPVTPYLSAMRPMDEQVSPLMITRLDLPAEDDAVADITVGIQEVDIDDEDDDVADDLGSVSSPSMIYHAPHSSSPILPVDHSSSPQSQLASLEDFEEDDDFALPPLLQRSWSSDSSSSIDSPECTTPTLGCGTFDDLQDTPADAEEEVWKGKDYGWPIKGVGEELVLTGRMERLRGF